MGSPVSSIARHFFTPKTLKRITKQVSGEALRSMRTKAEALADDVSNPLKDEFTHVIKNNMKIDSSKRHGIFFKIASDRSVKQKHSFIKAKFEPIGEELKDNAAELETYTGKAIERANRFNNLLNAKNPDLKNPNLVSRRLIAPKGIVTDTSLDHYDAYLQGMNTSFITGSPSTKFKFKAKVMQDGQLRLRFSEGKLGQDYKLKPAVEEGESLSPDSIKTHLEEARVVADEVLARPKEFTSSYVIKQATYGRVTSAEKREAYQELKKVLERPDVEGPLGEAGKKKYGMLVNDRDQLSIIKKKGLFSGVKHRIVPRAEQPMEKFLEEGAKFTKQVAEPHPNISPNVILESNKKRISEDGFNRHQDAANIMKEDDYKAIIGDLNNSKNRQLFKLKSNGTIRVADKDGRKVEVRNGNSVQDEAAFLKETIQYASTKSKHNQYLSREFGLEGNFFIGNHLSKQGLDARNEAITFFDAAKGALDRLGKDKGIQFKLRKDDSLVISGPNITTQTLVRDEDTSVTKFLEEALKEAKNYGGLVSPKPKSRMKHFFGRLFG